MGRAGFAAVVVLLLGSLASNAESQERQQAICGSCNAVSTDPDVINVHLVPHSHDDVGWLKTVDQYYYGARQDIQRAGVQHIIDSVITELQFDPTKRFIQVETAFFWRWWGEQDDQMKATVRTLVSEGRLELTGGGWSMNDEATTHYSAFIDNMALGLKTLKETFGDCGIPKVAWQIDPFGHSREQASLFAQMGFDALFFARIDYRDKDQRKTAKTLQMVWEGTDHLGEATSIFTGAFEGHYSAPGGFCFDILCSDDPVQDDPSLKDYNLDRMMENFIAHVHNSADLSMNPQHIMFTMGDDFNYQNAAMYYKSMDKLIKHLNADTATTKIHLLYSTPLCFVNALNEADHDWPTKTDDFFPYASGSHSYWTGYFTSRPSFKFHERQSNAILQSAKQINAMSENDRQAELRTLQNAMAVSQHHDAITGTAKQHVDSDYHLRLAEGQESSQLVIAQELFQRAGFTVGEGYYICPRLNISQCDQTEELSKLILLVYNPLPRASSPIIKLPVESSQPFAVYDETGVALAHEIVVLRNEVHNIPGRNSTADAELVFRATGVPALGYKTFYVEKQAGVSPGSSVLKSRPISVEEYQAELPDGLAVALKYYNGAQGIPGQSSGAYVFRPLEQTPTSSNIASVEKIDGTLVQEWRVVLDFDWASFTVRQYADQTDYEIEWLVGPIPVNGQIGKEVIMTYNSPLIMNAGKFWTDSNGRQMIPRMRGARSSYELVDGDQEEVSSNYNPITTGMFIQSEETSDQMSVLTDRSQGGASINDGEIELMVHRRLLVDDGYGVGEALDEHAFDEPLVVIGKHFYHSGGAQTSAVWRRKKSQENYLQPTLLFLETQITLDEWTAGYPNKQLSGLTRELPDNVNILTLETWNADQDVLLRVEHLFEEGEDDLLSQPAIVSLDGLFSTLSPIAVTEMTLGGNQVLAAARRLHWNTETWREGHEKYHDMAGKQDGNEIELKAMEIRTFLLKLHEPTPGKTQPTPGNSNKLSPSLVTLIVMTFTAAFATRM